jgi:hypothetical protein
MSERDEEGGRRPRIKAWHVVLALIVVLAGLTALHLLKSKGNVERRLEALRAAGYPTTFAELAEYTDLPEGVENAAGIYESAFASLVLPVDEANVPTLGTAKPPARGVPLSEAMARAVEQCLATNRQCLALLHEAAGIEHCRYGYDYRQMLAPAQDRRHAGQLLHVSAVYYANQGDTVAAVTAIEDGLRLSDSLQRESGLIGYLLRIGCLGLTLNGLERSLSLTAFTDTQLKELSAALARTGSTLNFTRAIVTERCFMIEIWRNPSRLGPTGPSLPVRMLPGMRQTWLTDILDHMGAYIEASPLPPAERLKRFRQIRDRMQQLSFLHVMAKDTTPAIARVAELDLRARAHLELAQTALAIERYRLAGGKVPQRLEELVPQYLKEVPSDPFDGNPIRYRRADPGYCLYSVSDDGQDNGGEEKADVPSGTPYDWCFIVTR